MTHPTDDEIMSLAVRYLGEHAAHASTGLHRFARALLVEQARPNADKLLRELIACEDERERLVNGVEPIEQFHRDSAKLDKRFTEALAQARECVATPLQTHKAEDAPSDAELLDWLEAMTHKGFCPAVVFDDGGHWAVLFDGVQSLPGDGSLTSSFFAGAGTAWSVSVRAAIRAAIAQERKA